MSFNMSRQRKVKELDERLMKTLKLCASEKICPEDFKRLTKPIQAIHLKWRRKERIKVVLVLSIIVAIIGVLYQCQATADFISAVAKIGMVKLVLPYWDWTTIHATDCLFENPYRDFGGITEEDCEPLVDLSQVERVEEMTQDDMTQDHLFSPVPVIITDATTDWKAVKDVVFDFDFISKLYNDDPVMSNTTLCGVSGINTTLTLQSFLESIPNTNSFQAHWGHCKLEAAKVLRQYYRRPYFLPAMVEADPKNFIIMGGRSSEEETLEYRRFEPANMQVTWVSQVKGQFKFKLIPDTVCEATVKVQEVTLQEGETLVYCNDFWYADYVVPSIGESVAISSGGEWSEN